MTDNQDLSDAPTIPADSPSLKAKEKKITPRKKKKTPTENLVKKKGIVKQTELVKWTVFVRPEVKIAVQKAAKKCEITDTEWLDSALWKEATDNLSKKAQPPAKVEDVADILKQFTNTLKANQEAATLAQNTLIEQQGTQIANLTQTVQAALNQPQPSIIDRILGRAGKAKTGE